MLRLFCLILKYVRYMIYSFFSKPSSPSEEMFVIPNHQLFVTPNWSNFDLLTCWTLGFCWGMFCFYPFFFGFCRFLPLDYHLFGSFFLQKTQLRGLNFFPRRWCSSTIWKSTRIGWNPSSKRCQFLKLLGADKAEPAEAVSNWCWSKKNDDSKAKSDLNQLAIDGHRFCSP